MSFFRRHIPFFLIRSIQFLKWFGITFCMLFIIDACDTTDSIIPAQDQVFIKLYGGSGSEEGKDLIVLPNDEGFVMVGSSTSKSIGGKDVYVVRTDMYGNVEWEETFGGAGDDVGSSVMLGSNNSIYVCGEKTQDSLGVLGLRDVYVLNIDLNNGSLIGDPKIYGDVIRDEFGTDIIELNNGGFFITSTMLHPDTSKYFLIETDNNLDSIPLKSNYVGVKKVNNYSAKSFESSDSNNPFINFGTVFRTVEELSSYWFRSSWYIGTGNVGNTPDHFGTQLYNEYCTDADQTQDGGFVLGGYSTDGEFAREIVVKINGDQSEIWGPFNNDNNNDYNNKSIKFKEIEQGECGIIQTMDRGYILSSTIELDDPKNDEISLLKLNESGEEEWRKTFGSNDDDKGAKVVQLSDGSFVVVGTIGFEINPNSNSKMCLMKINPEGDLVPMN